MKNNTSEIKYSTTKYKKPVTVLPPDYFVIFNSAENSEHEERYNISPRGE